VLAAVTGKLTARRADCAALAGKSTLNRLEHAPAGAPTRYHKIGHDGPLIERLFVDLFLDAQRAAPEEIVLDLDATDDPIHGAQEGRFCHGYYGGSCYLPLYVFCGDHLLAAKLRRSSIDASAGAVEEVERLVGHIRARWPQVRIVVRADSGFAREALMAWCEANRIDYGLGLARNTRLVAEIAAELALAKSAAEQTGKPARQFKDFDYQTLDSWSCARRVVGKAEQLAGGSGETSANPRFVVTSLAAETWAAQPLYEKLYCARGEMENRIKECQLDLLADRTSPKAMRSNQLRLWFAAMA
jgi:DDE family transposase